jgi:transitional endoplasmic reticulum ATPase
VVKRDPVFDTLIKHGVAAFQREDYRTARKQFSQAILRMPRDDRARFWLGATQYHLGNVGEAKKHLEEIKRSGEPPVADRPAAVHEYLCRCYLSSDTEKAIQFGEEGVRRDPDDPRLRLVTGNAYFRLNRHDAALEHFDAGWEAENGRAGTPAFAARPGQIPYARSSVFAALERWPEALSAIEDALVRDPDCASYHNRKGIILFDGLREAERALEATLRAIDLDPGTVATGNDGVYYYNAAVYLKHLKRYDEALSNIDKGISISPRQDYRALREQLLGFAQEKAAAQPPASPTLDYSHVGGMHGLKDQVRRIMRVIFSDRDEAKRYGIVRNGILLYGPPGCGKTFFAEAMAGEFGLNFQRVSLGSAQTKYVGAAAENIEKVFHEARSMLPCLLFFDEFDAIAGKRSDAVSQHEQQMVNALLQLIDSHRDTPGLVIAAATNRLGEIDSAAIREGRFDYKVKIYKPDFDARREIVLVLLRDRPHDATVDASCLAQDMEGFTAAQIRHVIDAAAMAAMEAESPISDGHLREALIERLEDVRYGGPRLDWDDLILPAETKRKLQFIEQFIENPELVKKLGVDPPTGVLLYGAPGTGKTTVARVLASQTDASFHAVNAADIFSKWLGESEQRVKELFEQARENVPAIIFIDEIESVLGSRADGDSGASRAVNAVVNTFLAEMDGIASNQRIFVIGATNRPDLLDEAVMRPGRLSEAVQIGLPDADGRLALLQLFTKKMKLGGRVDLVAIAKATEGASGADLMGLCTIAGRNALLRELGAGGEEPAVTTEDFQEALKELFPETAWDAEIRPIGFQTSQ